jgi:hypothetical protein
MECRETNIVEPQVRFWMMPKVSRQVLGAVVTFLVVYPALAGPNICWVDHVLAEGAAVRVLFSRGANIQGATKSQGRFAVGSDGITWLSSVNARTTERGLLLKVNESAILLGAIPEDTCTIKFAVIDGHTGVSAHSSFSVPPRPPNEKTVFIPSE